jgi:hypothetical protein
VNPAGGPPLDAAGALPLSAEVLRHLAMCDARDRRRAENSIRALLDLPWLPVIRTAAPVLRLVHCGPVAAEQCATPAKRRRGRKPPALRLVPAAARLE